MAELISSWQQKNHAVYTVCGVSTGACLHIGKTESGHEIKVRVTNKKKLATALELLPPKLRYLPKPSEFIFHYRGKNRAAIINKFLIIFAEYSGYGQLPPYIERRIPTTKINTQAISTDLNKLIEVSLDMPLDYATAIGWLRENCYCVSGNFKQKCLEDLSSIPL